MRRVRVTGLHRTKRGRYSIYLDGEFYCVLHEEIFFAAGLAVDSVVSLDDLEQLRRTSQDKLAREKALALLSARSYTARDLYHKLCRHVDESGAKAAVVRMMELGLVDDADYARRFAADRVNRKGYSQERVTWELAQKGVSREVIQQVLEEREDDPRQQIEDLVRCKYLHRLKDEKGLRRTVEALRRLGYRYGDILAVLGEMEEGNDN